MTPHPQFPFVPAELWMLWDSRRGAWLVSADDAPGGTTYLVATSEADARVAAEHQWKLYGVECVVYRVK